MTQLLVNEVFQSIQGEGAFVGVPSIFVRLQGCPVGCPWCDTQHTWETKPQYLQPSNIVLMENQPSETYFAATPEKLFSLFKQQEYTANHIVITGGEPCMFDLNELTKTAINKGMSVQIETSGTFDIKCHEDTWVTLSPKINMPGKYKVLEQAVLRANEIKHVIAMQKHIDELQDLISDIPADSLPPVYLQPVSQQKRATELAVKVCIEKNWRFILADT